MVRPEPPDGADDDRDDPTIKTTHRNGVVTVVTVVPVVMTVSVF
jgi:hypothetical protein